MFFDWDDLKAELNKRKHGISFAEAATTFSDSNALEIFDNKSSETEDRWILVGRSIKSHMLLVVFVEREGNCIRIISARKAIKDEINDYFSRIKK
jgi:uncharacterized DUF497 family protein